MNEIMSEERARELARRPDKLTVDIWLELLAVAEVASEPFMITCRFPSDAVKQAYLSTVEDRSEQEVHWLLLKFLIANGRLGADDDNLRTLTALMESPDEPQQAIASSMLERDYHRRLLLAGSEGAVWEGITWVVDLLPHRPLQALSALQAYYSVHCQFLPDGRLNGLEDAIALVRARYIVAAHAADRAEQVIASLDCREFEVLVANLFRRMGFAASLTPRSHDGGRDVVATRSGPLGTKTLVECKAHSAPVGVEYVRALLGVVSHEKVDKGILVSASTFTRGSEQFAAENPRLELISREQLIQLLNSHLGANWSELVAMHVDERTVSPVSSREGYPPTVP